MRGNLADLLSYEAGRRPALHALMQRAADLSDGEIDDAKLPLPWMRKALRQARDQAARCRHLVATESDLDGHFIDIANPDPLGDIRRWTAPDRFVTVDRGNLILIPHNRLIWLADDDGWWFETLFSRHRDDGLLLASSQFVRRDRRSVYATEYRAEINKTTVYLPVNPANPHGIRFA